MRERLDKVLVSMGLAASRERAKALIMEGKVLVDGRPASKAGAEVGPGADIKLRGEDIPYVSRGGLKIEAAARHFGIDFSGAVAMDVGSSTGGFTDYMLQAGARRVYCVDVGYGQLAWKLRSDPRVVVMERTNIRYLERTAVADIIDIAAVDVSFISLDKVIPKLMEFLSPSGAVLALVKPQFEVGRGEVGRGGVVRSEEKRLGAVESLKKAFAGMGLGVGDVFESPVHGQKGNIEYFVYLKR